jgi:hypothetical protein
MTLNDLVQRLRKPPVKGSHEIVKAADGMNHLVIITMARDVYESGVTVREFAFHSWCNNGSFKADELEVMREESITCMMCIQWRTT